MIIMNRNTSPISPFSEENYREAYLQTSENQYPYLEINRFKANYAHINNDFPVEHIELANGSDEWIQKLMIIYGQGGVLVLDPDFFMYQEYARQLNCPIDFVPATADFSFNIADIVQKIEESHPKLFILSSPHNPTGRQFSEQDLQTLADAVEKVDGFFIIDEAYVEFGQSYNRPKGDHVILLRTMSKIYGMAGLRIGIIRATGKTYEDVTKINHPYPVNTVSLNLANAFLENDTNVQNFIDYQLKSNQKLDRAFSAVADKMNVLPSQANFVFTYGDNALSLGNYLKANGFQGRFYKEKGLEQVVRYSIIKLEDYELLETMISNWRNSLD